MNTRVAKVIELVGTSPTSWQDAVEVALREASRTIRNISGIEVTNQTAEVENDRIVGRRVSVKIAFGIEREGEA
ncbi:MAG: dodecin domain-containing protein [Chloroflexi bacterium]|nr:dodecin domain-containing protein [Chloroflexota bacterium]